MRVLSIMQMSISPIFSKNLLTKSLDFQKNLHMLIFKWFGEIQFQANAGKFYLLLSVDHNMQVNIGATQIEDSSSKKLLCVTIDTKPIFEKHIEQIMIKQGQS